MTALKYLASALALAPAVVTAQIRGDRPETMCLVQETGLGDRRCPDGMEVEGYYRTIEDGDVQAANSCGRGGSVGPVVQNGDFLLQDGLYTYDSGEAGPVRGRKALGSTFPNGAQRFDMLMAGQDLVGTPLTQLESITFDAYVSDEGQWTMYLYLVNSAEHDLEAEPDFYADCIVAYTPRNPAVGEWQTFSIEPDTLGSQFFHESEIGCVNSRLSGYGEEWVLYSGLKGAQCPVSIGFSVLAGDDKEAFIDNIVIKTKAGDDESKITLYDFE